LGDLERAFCLWLARQDVDFFWARTPALIGRQRELGLFGKHLSIGSDRNKVVKMIGQGIQEIYITAKRSIGANPGRHPARML